MPIYEYKCSSCGHQQEYLQKVSDARPTHCPACGKDTFSKMVTAAGFQLKGSGWYATDFKGSGSKPAAGNGGAKTEGAKTEGAKTEGAKTEGAKTEGGKAEGAKGEAKSESKKESSSPSSATGGSPSGS